MEAGEEGPEAVPPEAGKEKVEQSVLVMVGEAAN